MRTYDRIMCGRYALFTLADLAREYSGFLFPPDLRPRYNIAPTQPVLALSTDAPNRFDYFHWGLIPAWAKDPSIGNRMINARAETLGEKPAFKPTFQRRRCLIPADGFYEWRKEPDGKSKTPMFIQGRDRKPLFLAGLWDQWRSPDGESIRSCTIITGSPNELVRPIHDRMPVILPPEQHATWLNPQTPLERLQELLRPFPAEAMEAHPVSRRVNSPTNDDESCIRPAEPPTLF